MSSIENALSETVKNILEVNSNNLSKQEKISIALKDIYRNNPNKKFSFQDVAIFLKLSARAPRGIATMVRSISEKDPDFPSDMIKPKNQSGSTSYSIDKINQLLSETNLQ